MRRMRTQSNPVGDRLLLSRCHCWFSFERVWFNLLRPKGIINSHYCVFTHSFNAVMAVSEAFGYKSGLDAMVKILTNALRYIQETVFCSMGCHLLRITQR